MLRAGLVLPQSEAVDFIVDKQAQALAMDTTAPRVTVHDMPRDSRLEWGLGTIRQYLGLFIDRVSECLNFSTFVIASNLRDLTLTQVVSMEFFCANVRRTTLEGSVDAR